ncbi:hypothetical protein [Nocardia wallacei]|uniref:hypothetical protein n=1 Tax=Nocardia wallacei TaxID=480035 RepID=UPI002455D62C|nr:hypothetical protein [Nocardia wallacei]
MLSDEDFAQWIHDNQDKAAWTLGRIYERTKDRAAAHARLRKVAERDLLERAKRAERAKRLAARTPEIGPRGPRER